MYVKLGNIKRLVEYVTFQQKKKIGNVVYENEKIKINGEITINFDHALDIRQNIVFEDIQLHKDWYTLPEDYEKIKKVLEDM
ncbi:MAG: hypothetical protein RR795_01550 [Cetobacterium sp.]|uniref:hypothetical protein n=1 Tax=Cetobacterium sp. TaxID=2071632 RepID=UPI002FC6CBF9